MNGTLNKMKTKFEIADANGRKLFKEYCNTQSWCKVIKESKNEYAHWDIAYTSGSTMIIGEIKVREYKSDAFCDWDYEEKKHNNLLVIYDQMKEKHPNKKVEIQYINIFKNEAVKIWTTTNIANQQQPIVKYRPQTTMGNDNQVTKGIYKCNLENEANRGTLTPLVYPTRPQTNEDDILPF
jgi:hypothetical protein